MKKKKTVDFTANKNPVRFGTGFHASFTGIIYTSILAYLAFFSINSRRGATSSPISIEKV